MKSEEPKKNRYYYVPPVTEQEILNGAVEDMQRMRTLLWEQVNKKTKDLENLQNTIKSIMSQMSQLDKYVFKSRDPSFVLDPETMSSLKALIQDIEEKIRYLSLLEASDAQYITGRLLQICKDVDRLESRTFKTSKQVEELDQSENERKQCLRELHEDIRQIQSM